MTIKNKQICDYVCRYVCRLMFVGYVINTRSKRVRELRPVEAGECRASKISDTMRAKKAKFEGHGWGR